MGKKRLLGGTRGIREEWASQAGQPHLIGVELNVGVSDTNRKDTEYQLRGVVDVPSLPRSDDERDFLARQLFEAADIPNKKSRCFQLFNWVSTEGGNGISIRRCGPIFHFTDKDIIGEVKRYISPEFEEPDDIDQICDEKYNEWTLAYCKNRYCRFESREDLHQRLQDIQVNAQVLKPSGKLGLTDETVWFELMQHVIVELLLRGEPPNEKNQHPRVPVVRPFFDGELCRKAAAVVSSKGTTNDMIVKYGKREHIKALVEKGTVYLNPASDYDKPIHNPAIRDDECTIVFKGGCSSADDREKFYDINTVPAKFEELIENGRLEFLTICQCPRLKRHEFLDLRINKKTDYWIFCMADVLDQRLFADFEADSCVVIQREPFIKRLFSIAWTLPNTNPVFGRVNYVDPLGAFSGRKKVRVDCSIPMHLTKVFRYAYQREMRFVFVPRKFQEKLEPREMQIGSIADIAEFITL